jgi:hypothetical protein
MVVPYGDGALGALAHNSYAIGNQPGQIAGFTDSALIVLKKPLFLTLAHKEILW